MAKSKVAEEVKDAGVGDMEMAGVTLGPEDPGVAIIEGPH